MRTRDKIVLTAQESLLFAQIQLQKISPIAGALFAMFDREESILRDSIWCDGATVFYNPLFVQTASREDLVAQICWCMLRLTGDEATAIKLIEEFDQRLFRRERKISIFTSSSSSCTYRDEWSQVALRLASYFKERDNSPLGTWLMPEELCATVAKSSIQPRLIQTALAMPSRARIPESAEEQFWIVAGLAERGTNKTPNKAFKATCEYLMRLPERMCAAGMALAIQTNYRFVFAGPDKAIDGSFIAPLRDRFKNVLRVFQQER